MGSKEETNTSLSPEQLACISSLTQLFPEGFLFCTPVRMDGSEPRSYFDDHVFFSCHEFPRIWSALQGFFAAKRPTPPRDT